MKILICNAGSSSIKFSLIEAEHERTVVDGEIDWTAKPASLSIREPGRPPAVRELRARNHGEAIEQVLAELGLGPSAPSPAPHEILGVGHRVVHGGERYSSAVRITPEVRRQVEALAELAPLHNSASLEVIDSVGALLPGTPQVAAFDTAFHATLSEAARTYAVPGRWTSEWRVRRYGFHGLNHSYCAARAAEMLGAQDLRLIVAHLGSGASVSGVRNGRCVDTSMGFTPLEGLMMGTRSGSVDPGMLLYLMREKGLNALQLDHALNHESGLLGVSGVSSDMRDVLAAAKSGNPHARLAIDVYVHRLQQTIGGMAATLGGVDGLVFTAGVGEHAPLIRERVCANLGWLGLELDRSANAACTPDDDIATRDSRARILVITAREDLTIVREVRRLLQVSAAEGVLS